MTLSELQRRTLTRAGEDPDAPRYFTAPMAVAALNRAQRLFVLRSLAVERSASFTLTAATTWFHVRTQLADFLQPLRLDYATTRLRPARLSELDALDAGWQASAGDPQRYSLAGLDLLAVYRQLAAGGTLTVTYAAAPVRLIDADDVPEIPAEYHDDLVDGAVPLLRLAEGGQEMSKALPGLRKMLAGAYKLAAYVRQRSLDLRYDRLPQELDNFDLSRQLAIPQRRPTPWLTTSDSRPEAAQT